MYQIQKKNTLILVDGSFYLYRAYHALPSLNNIAGEPTGAMYGVLNMLKSLLIQYQPSHVAVVFDTKDKTFRDQLFEHYKLHRPIMPENLRKQITPLYDMVKAMGLPILSISGIEADDVIGTLAITAARDGCDVRIITGDKDIAQLVSSKITMTNTLANTIIGPEEVKTKFGVPPALIIDYLALMGDRADNIPGVMGIGKKTAQILLHEIGGLETIYQQLDSISILCCRGAKNIATKLEQQRDLAFLSYQLATIKTDVVLDLSYYQLTVEEPQYKLLRLLFQRYEFKRWLSDLNTGKWLQKTDKNAVTTPSPWAATRPVAAEDPSEVISTVSYSQITDMATLDSWINMIHNNGVFAFNTATDGLDTMTANLVGLFFAVKPGKVTYLLLGQDYLNEPHKLDQTAVLTALKTILEDPTISKIGFNLKFDQGILNQYHIHLAGITFDTMLESYVLNSVAGKHDIASIAKRFLQYTTVNFDKIAVDQYKLMFNHSALEQTITYAAHADIILRLHQTLWPRLEQAAELKKVFEQIDIPLVPVLSRIERNGVLIDEQLLAKYSVELTNRLEELELEAHKLVKKPFNLTSTKQLQAILCDKKQKLQTMKQYLADTSFNNNKEEQGKKEAQANMILVMLAYALQKLIAEYRIIAKLKSNYTDKLPKMINKLSNRIHTSYHQAITATGRLSSSYPNLQNIPVRNNAGRRIRQAFIAPPDTLILAADYSQIELRIITHLSSDPGLLTTFAAGKDIHRATAAEVFGLPFENVTQDQRRRAKAINFGLIYGMSAFGLSRQLSIPRLAAQKYINRYFQRHPGVLEYMELTRRQATSKGYVATMEGRRIYLPNINSRNSIRKKSAERAAINAPIQGTAADIIKRAMIAVDSWLQQEAPPIRMIMQVHDELVFEVHKNAVENAKARIQALMEGCFALDVPLQVKVGVGENWAQAH